MAREADAKRPRANNADGRVDAVRQKTVTAPW
jgi:hypothetical protein